VEGRGAGARRAVGSHLPANEQLTSMQRRLRLRGGAADFFHQASTVLQGERARVACVPRRCCCVVLTPSLGDADPFFSFFYFSFRHSARPLAPQVRRAPICDVLRMYDGMCQRPSARSRRSC